MAVSFHQLEICKLAPPFNHLESCTPLTRDSSLRASSMHQLTQQIVSLVAYHQDQGCSSQLAYEQSMKVLLLLLLAVKENEAVPVMFRRDVKESMLI